MIYYAAYAVGMLPLLWLAGLRVYGAKRGSDFWWLAGAFGVSFAADTWSLFGPDGISWVASIVYPVSQAALIALVLLDRDDAMTFTMALLAAGMISVVLFGAEGPDTLLRSVAWLGVAGITLKFSAIGLVRWALFLTFGGGWLLWLPYAYSVALWKLGIMDMAFAFDAWLAYKTVWLLGTLAFCWSASNPESVRKLTSPLRAREWISPYVLRHP